MCQVFKVSRGGYYAWVRRPLSPREKENLKLIERIKAIHDASGETYGSPRITDCLLSENFKVSRPRVARLMNRFSICAKTHRKFKVTTDSDHKYPIAPNLLKRDFTAKEPRKFLTSDITYIDAGEGWLYLTIVMDLFNREILGWSMSKSLKASDTTIAALEDAFNRHHLSPEVIFHSDRGIQYACDEFRKKLTAYQMIQSMSSKGNCYDNAVTESFFATLKKELVYQQKYRSRLQAKQSLFMYIEMFYNRKRKHSFLGNMSPEEFLKLKLVA